MKLASIIAATAAMVSMSAVAATDYGSNDFESYATEAKIGTVDTTWTQDADDMSSVAEYTEKVTAPSAIATGNTKYLKLETEGKVLSKALSGTAAGTTVYVDSYVKLVGNETAPTLDPTARIAVWLAKEDIEGVAAAGSLVVTVAGTHWEVKTDNETTLQDGSWNRITIESVTSEILGTSFFRVWLNEAVCYPTKELVTEGDDRDQVYSGSELRAGGEGELGVDDTATYAYFDDGTGVTPISAVGFQGTGAVDNLAATDTNPFGGTPVVDIFFGKEEGVDSEKALAWAADNGLEKANITGPDSAQYYNQYILNVAPNANAELVIASIAKTDEGADITVKAVVAADGAIEAAEVDSSAFNGKLYIKSAATLAGLEAAEEVEVTPTLGQEETEAVISVTGGAFFRAYVK